MSPLTVESPLVDLNAASTSEKDLRDRFEKLIWEWSQTEPPYADPFDMVWTGMDSPDIEPYPLTITSAETVYSADLYAWAAVAKLKWRSKGQDRSVSTYNPRNVLNITGKVTTASVETLRIASALPLLRIHPDQSL